ncbi:hypothetical protein RRG08_049308 [Elysia crispata]|uniref:Uncharacterized protein n=1 Tax=Elysia crispata TaxID=231223 RepID=A0AAE1E845_9GAST|nr:hypothetical protein RRG08_049308 [Elysia crispata]
MDKGTIEEVDHLASKTDAPVKRTRRNSLNKTIGFGTKRFTVTTVFDILRTLLKSGSRILKALKLMAETAHGFRAKQQAVAECF